MLVSAGDSKIVRTKSSISSLKIGAILFSIFAGFACYKMFSFMEPLGQYAPYGLGFFGGYCFYKMQIDSIERDSYESIAFFSDYFIVDFAFRPKLKIEYKDVVGLSAAFEEHPTTLTLTGNYPILFLALYPLERDYDKEFVEFLVRKGFVA